MKQVIQSKNAPQAIGTYSQAIKSGNTLYVSGQIGMNPDTMELAKGDFTAEARQAFQNLQAVIEAAGATLADALKLTIYVTDLNDFADVNTVMAEFFSEPYPARACVQVSALPKGARFELDAIVNTLHE